MKDFKDKVAFITGGASGAGLGQAKVFSGAGMKVVIADVRQDHLDEASAYFKKQKNARVHAIKLDITDRKAYAKAADEVEQVFGSPPQLLLNTAGVNAFGPAEASTFEDYDWIIGVDLMGVINGLVTFVPRMIKAGKGGYIAAVSSMSAFMAAPTVAPYGAAKAGLVNLMEAYWMALKPYGIGVSCLCPVGIKTNIAEASYTRPQKLANTGYNTNEKTIAFMRHHYSFGIDPVELAQILKKGIEDEVLFVLPFPEPERWMKQYGERMVNLCTKEGMVRQTKLDAERALDREKHPMPGLEGAAEAGWGSARPDLTWVKKSDRFKKKE